MECWKRNPEVQKREEADDWGVSKTLQEMAAMILQLRFWRSLCAWYYMFSASNFMIDIFSMYPLKEPWFLYIDHWVSIKSLWNGTKQFLVVCCELPSWGQTKQTDDFQMLPKESCVSSCVVTLIKQFIIRLRQLAHNLHRVTTTIEFLSNCHVFNHEYSLGIGVEAARCISIHFFLDRVKCCIQHTRKCIEVLIPYQNKSFQ